MENEIIRIMEMIDDGEMISDHHILDSFRHNANPPDPIPGSAHPPQSIREKLRDVKWLEIERLMMENKGNKSRVARILGMSYRGFLKKLQRMKAVHEKHNHP